MGSVLNPYLNFKDNARQAMEFYQTVFGGELRTNTFAELQGSEDPADADKLMHSQLTTPSGFTLMGADTPAYLEYQPAQGFSVSLSGADDAELRGYWDRLSEGGNTVVPLEVAPWGDAFGMLVDKFGTSWMVNIAGTGQSPSN